MPETKTPNPTIKKLEELKAEGYESECDCRGLGHTASVDYWKGYQAGIRAAIELIEKTEDGKWK